MNQVDQHAIEYYGYDNQGGSIGIPKRSQAAIARKETNEWLENMTPEERQQLHEYNEQLKKDYEDGKYY